MNLTGEDNLMRLSRRFLQMLNPLNIFRKEYRTLNKIELSKNNLIHNYQYLSSLKKVKIAPVIKSSGYGHGILNVAKILEPQNPPFFCVDSLVDSLYEAYELLKIKTPVLIMGYTDPENFKVKKLPFSFAVFDIKTAGILNKYQTGCSIHIFVDTGMRREGVTIDELPEFLTQIKQFTNIRIEGLMSHLASADDIKDLLNEMQIKNFKKALEICKTNGIKPKYIHIQNSDGLKLNLKGCNVNMARVGLALYKSVLSLKSKIIQIKTLKKNNRVGYSGTFTAGKNTTIAILPIGYYDGVDRRLSNKGFVQVDNVFCPIIGRVSMNITTIDISQVKNPFVGQEVIVYSNNPKDKNSIENTAKICKTIPYDILIHLAASTKRITI